MLHDRSLWSSRHFVGPNGTGNPLFTLWGHFSDHEMEIVRIVNRIDIEGRLDTDALDEIVGKLSFILSEAEGDFLVDYLRWRMEHPLVK